MLRNYGFNVIDLGKDVPCDRIISVARENNASIIGLSALMTTTMVKMKDVVDCVKENKLPYKVVIGGAVITQSYADEIGADGYSKDAAECVTLVKKLLGL
jgi:5-methyltetrahydrofolate--homocysteine methyltransferase